MVKKTKTAQSAAKETDKQVRARIDWEAVELDYRSGVKTLRIMAAIHGCAESAIRKKAKEQGWERDLSAKVRQKADELVRKEEVRKKVRTDPEFVATERKTVEVLAQTQADIIIGQRSDISRSRGLVMKLLEELEGQTDQPELMEKLAELATAEMDDKAAFKMREIFNRVVSLGGRSSVMKQLADSLKVLVALEREAFGIAGMDEGAGKAPAGTDSASGPEESYLKMLNG